MGGAVAVDTVRPGVEFIPEAALAFRRAELQLGREIDVNSTYRSWDTQMRMHFASVAYRNGTGPYPGHSWAAHPSISFHVGGTALDSDDWRNAEVRTVLAENGFIRNRLDVAGEDHHFEWLREYDKHYGEEIEMPLSESDINKVAAAVWRYKMGGGPKNGDEVPTETAGERLRNIRRSTRGLKATTTAIRAALALVVKWIPGTDAKLAAIEAAVEKDAASEDERDDAAS